MARSSALAREAIRTHQLGHLNDRLIARVTGAAPATVRDWLALRSSPTGARADRLAELSAIVDRLSQVMSPAYIPVWLNKPVAALAQRKPVDLLAQGRYPRVARLISSLEDPDAA